MGVCFTFDSTCLFVEELFFSCSHIHLFRVRELSADKLGTLVCVVGQIVRTHPVHPELYKGVFTCNDCGSTIDNVEQQFRYTQVN